MQVGIGLPTTTPGVDRSLFFEWVRRAEQGPFSSLGVFDRLAYDSLDPLVSLATAAAMSSRLRLATTILTGPLYNTALLGKSLASLDMLSGGRLVVGLAIGARDSAFDLLQLHFAQGYLLASFLSPLSNRRSVSRHRYRSRR